jgi:hypothetical protein
MLSHRVEGVPRVHSNRRGKTHQERTPGEQLARIHELSRNARTSQRRSASTAHVTTLNTPNLRNECTPNGTNNRPTNGHPINPLPREITAIAR